MGSPFWAYMGIAQTPSPLSNGQTWKKVLQTILTSLYTPPFSNAHGINTFQKGASLWGMTNPSIHSLEHIAHEAIYVSSVNRTNSENRVSGGSKVNSVNTVNSVNSV